MLGAIAGDIIGSIYEGKTIKTTDFPLFGKGCRFTDDTVLTVATADCILNGKDYAETYLYYVWESDAFREQAITNFEQRGDIYLFQKYLFMKDKIFHGQEYGEDDINIERGGRNNKQGIFYQRKGQNTAFIETGGALQEFFNRLYGEARDFLPPVTFSNHLEISFGVTGSLNFLDMLKQIYEAHQDDIELPEQGAFSFDKDTLIEESRRVVIETLTDDLANTLGLSSSDPVQFKGISEIVTKDRGEGEANVYYYEIRFEVASKGYRYVALGGDGQIGIRYSKQYGLFRPFLVDYIEEVSGGSFDNYFIDHIILGDGRYYELNEAFDPEKHLFSQSIIVGAWQRVWGEFSYLGVTITFPIDKKNEPFLGYNGSKTVSNSQMLIKMDKQDRPTLVLTARGQRYTYTYETLEDASETVTVTRNDGAWWQYNVATGNLLSSSELVLVISGITISEVNQSGATVTWRTDEPATSKI